ncbi:terminase gpA endonuclease subunit [Maridesulfovibrio ferrireducens]|uniref:terminase gpA endonuclease subunit n=1 Tax=Maridesulfovibrio ferrireducens TaxID=246191 RepID=UPI001A1D0396|nr:terminase gpA endonuclease subunit [Maridesulfovibrio ferrireducens]MBI9109984.1 phage terminase large subunit family protein [Maridesulfovibrio ferrireducens]
MTTNIRGPIKFYPGELQILEAREWMSTADFAEKHFVLVAGSYAGQRFNHDFAPYARGIMDIWDKPWVREVIVAGSSQTVKTSIGYACVCSEIWREPSGAGLGMPDKDVAKRILDEKLSKHFLRSPELRKLLPDGENSVQTLKIAMRSANLYAMYSGSEASMSSISLRVLMLDEEDAYPDSGATDTMIERTIGYPVDRKIIRVSKPRGNEHESSIWDALKNRADVVYQYQAVCPSCGHAQLMEKKNIRVPDKMRDPATIKSQKLAWYECQGCGAKWNDYQRNIAIKNGRWFTEHEVLRPETVAFHIPSWISRYISLSTVAADWFTAVEAGTPKAYTKFDNNHCAKPYKVVAVETDETRAKKMVDPRRPPMVVPLEALALTCGIDMQMTGFWFVVRAWGRGLESWLIQYGWLNSFDELDELIFRTRYPVEGRDDVVMPIWRAPIDMGGGRDKSNEQGWSRTDEVKMYLQEIETGARPGTYPGVVFAVKGASRKQTETIRLSQMGAQPGVAAKYQQKLPLRTLDTDEFKDKIHLVRLNPASKQPMWMHSQTGEDYFRQLLAEKRKSDGKGGVQWDAGSRDNHLFDCEVYAAAGAEPLWTPSLMTLGQPIYIPKNPIVPPKREPTINPYTGEVC